MPKGMHKVTPAERELLIADMYAIKAALDRVCMERGILVVGQRFSDAEPARNPLMLTAFGVAGFLLSRFLPEGPDNEAFRQWLLGEFFLEMKNAAGAIVTMPKH